MTDRLLEIADSIENNRSVTDRDIEEIQACLSELSVENDDVMYAVWHMREESRQYGDAERVRMFADLAEQIRNAWSDGQ